jgi:hypothetical protein
MTINKSDELKNNGEFEGINLDNKIQLSKMIG